MIDIYNSAEPTKLRFIARLIAMRIRLKGFIVFDYQPRMEEFFAAMVPWLKSGQVKAQETVVEGLEKAPEAFPRIVFRAEYREDVGEALESVFDPKLTPEVDQPDIN